eukprot:scaffold13478_cov132-Cylindrotheca_fusiformis.AAC.1
MTLDASRSMSSTIGWRPLKQNGLRWDRHKSRIPCIVPESSYKIGILRPFRDYIKNLAWSILSVRSVNQRASALRAIDYSKCARARAKTNQLYMLPLAFQCSIFPSLGTAPTINFSFVGKLTERENRQAEKPYKLKMPSTKSTVVASIDETARKVKASLLPAIESSITSNDFSREDMLDFLDVKNSLLASYMIDLTVYVRNKIDGTSDEENLHRLTEMKTVLDKMRGLDKKLRYQIEKLLNANTTASTYASGGGNSDDPLQFRPDLHSLKEAGDQSEKSDDDSSQGDDQSDGDEDLKAARATLSLAKEKKSSHQRNEHNDNLDGIYHAPRLAAVPYTHDLENKQKEKEKRAKRRLRATELAQTLRSEYGDVPEQEDIHGGSDYGKQRAAARRLAEREAEKIRAEEDGMVRLMTSRKDKKEKKRLMRMESSNLGAIADLGNLVRETREFGRRNNSDEEDSISEPPSLGREQDRHHNGKRSRGADTMGDRPPKRRGKPSKPKNALQSALYASGEGSKKKKRSRR